jgi:AraC-like DNA-binding protein
VSSPAAPSLHAVTVVDISDPADANAGIELIDLDAVQLRSEPFRARRVVVRAGAATVVFHSSNVRLRTRTSSVAGQVGYVVFGPEASGSVNGIPVRQELMLAVGPSAEARFVVDARWESISILLPAQHIRAHLVARQRSSKVPQALEVVTVAADPAAVRRLFDWCKQLTEAAAAQPPLFNERPGESPALQVDLLENLLAAIGQANACEPGGSDRTRQRRSLVVKAAEDYALAQNGAHLCVSDLRRVTGVSERSLEYAFKEVMGLTPVAFLNRVRLHRVRQALLAATPRSTTVAAEALRWGYWHFGEFARAYSDCFGELPSQTLGRNRDYAKGYKKPD